MNRSLRISVIIVTWNGDPLLEACLESLHRVYGTELEIVVVDNANLELTRRLSSAFANVKYVAAPENLGFAGGNNLGLAFCTREYILLLNNDTVVHDDSFSPLAQFLDEHRKVGIVQGTMIIPGFGFDDCGVQMTPFGIQRHLHRGESDCGRLHPRRVTAAKGAMMMIRRKAVDDCGFLFYDHFKSYFEETDFCRRATNHGWEVWFVPTPPIDHLCGATSSKFARDDVWRQYFRNILYSFARNWGFWGRFVMLPSFAFAAFCLSPRNLISAVGSLRRE